MDEVADVHLTRAGAAVDRRAELRIVEIELRRLDRGFVGRHRAGLRIRARAIGIELLPRDKLFADQRLVAVRVALRIGELSLVAGEIGLRLRERRLVRPRIDLEQEIADLHLLPFGEIDFDDRAVDAAFHRYVVISLDAAETSDVDRHVARRRGPGRDRHRFRRAVRLRHGLARPGAAMHPARAAENSNNA